MSKKINEIGFSRKIMGLPLEMSKAWRSELSRRGVRMKDIKNGAIG